MKDLIIEKLYQMTQKPYQRYFKKGQPWQITKQQLIWFPQDTLGFRLGCFLLKYDFQLQPKLEDHDVFHVLTNTGITVPEEIAMQFFLLGNGKRSLYLFMVIVTGACLYPTRLKSFTSYYKRGKTAYHIYDLPFGEMLYQPIHNIQSQFNIQ